MKRNVLVQGFKLQQKGALGWFDLKVRGASGDWEPSIWVERSEAMRYAKKWFGELYARGEVMVMPSSVSEDYDVYG
jgi:hypothetical protein